MSIMDVVEVADHFSFVALKEALDKELSSHISGHSAASAVQQ